MALDFPDNFPFNRKPDEPTVDPVVEAAAPPEAEPAPAVAPQVVAASPVSAAEPVAFTTTTTIAADVIAQSVAQAVAQAVNANPAAAAAAASAAAPAPTASAVPAAGPESLSKAQDAAMSRAEGGPPPGMKERRRVPRQTLVAKTTVRSESQLTVVAAGFVSNISMMGVGFHTRKPLAVGEKYQIRLEVGPMKWASRLRVITCRQHGDTYDIGAEFVGNELASLARRELAA